MKSYNIDYIGNLRIHELRDFAKQLGVSSPTTMKKDELITQISTIMGRAKSSNTSHMSRSDVNEADFLSLLTCDNSDILSDLLSNNTSLSKSKNSSFSDCSGEESALIVKKSNNIFNNTYKIAEDELMKLAFSVKQDKAKYGDDNVTHANGYVDIHPSGYGIIRRDCFLPSKDDVYITSSMVKQYNLKKGNFIKAKAKYAFINKPRIACEILEVDGLNKGKGLKSFDTYEYNGLGDKFNLAKFKLHIKRGERNYIENMCIEDAVSFGFDIVDENGVEVKFLNIKARPEENYKSHQKMQIINLPFNCSGEDVLTTLELIMERVKREFEQKKTNVLIIYNISELMCLINTVYGDGYLNYEKFNSKALEKIHNILYLAKFVDKNNSNTVIFIDKNGVIKHLEQVFEYELKPLFNNIISKFDKK